MCPDFYCCVIFPCTNKMPLMRFELKKKKNAMSHRAIFFPPVLASGFAVVFTHMFLLSKVFKKNRKQISQCSPL